MGPAQRGPDWQPRRLNSGWAALATRVAAGPGPTAGSHRRLAFRAFAPMPARWAGAAACRASVTAAPCGRCTSCTRSSAPADPTPSNRRPARPAAEKGWVRLPGSSGVKGCPGPVGGGPESKSTRTPLQDAEKRLGRLYVAPADSPTRAAPGDRPRA